MNKHSTFGRSIRAQRGVVLFIALIALVAMSLAGIGLMRSVGNGVAVAGNMALKKATTAAGERGIVAAGAYLLSLNSVALQNNIGSSYFATYEPGGVAFDPVTAGHAWWRNNATVVNVAGTSYEDMDIRYVIHRLCDTTGEVSDDCVRMGAAQDQRYGCVQGGFPVPCSTLKYGGYRVTTRIVGPKNSVSYVQVVLF